MKVTAEEKLLESVETKLQTVIGHNDELEAHHVTAHGHLSNIHTKINTHNDATIRGINNTGSIGDGSTNATTVSLGYDRTNGQARALLVDSSGKLEVNNTDVEGLLGTIATNTSNINLNVDTLEVNTDGLETLVGASNTHLSEIEGAVETLEACVGSNKVNVNISSGAITGFATQTTLAEAEVHLGAIDTNLGLAEAHIGNIDAGIDVLEACVGSNKVNVNISSGNISGFATQTTLAEAEVHLGAIDTNLGLAEAHLGTIDTNVGNAETHLGNIDTGIDVLEACVGSNKVNVNISSGNISGFATQTTLAEAEVHLGAIDTNLGLAEAHLGTIDTNVGNAETHLGNIDTGIDVLEACVGSNKVNVNISSGNISGFATQTTLAEAEVHLGAIETKVGEIDTVLDNIKVDTEAIETAVEILDDIVLTEDTAHNSGDKGVMFLGVHQSSQADFGADGDYVPLSINDDGELRVTSGSSSSATGQFLATSTTLSSYSLSTVLDVSAYKNVRLMGKESGGSVSSIPVYGSQTSGGTYYGLSTTDWLNQASVTESGSGSTYFMSATINNTPKFLKIFNNTGSDITIELDYVAHK